MIDLTWEDIGEHLDKGDLEEWLKEERAEDKARQLSEQADTPQTDCKTCKYGEDKHRYAHICNECGVGIDNYTPQTDKDKVVCPNCGRSDYIRSFEKDFGIKNSEYRYKCINCNTYIKDTPQTESHITCYGTCTDKCGAYEHGDCTLNARKVDAPQTDCAWK